MLVQVDRVADDGADGRRRDHIRVEAILFHGLLLLHRRAISHVHRLSQRPFDVVVIGRQVEEVLVEQLDVCLRLHDEVRLLLASLCQEGNVPVDDVYLAPLLRHQLRTIEDADATDDRASDDRQQHCEQCEPCLLL